MNAIQQEIVLARDYNGTLNIRHDVQGFENTASKGRPGLSKKIVNMYLNKNGSRFTDMQGYATKVFLMNVRTGILVWHRPSVLPDIYVREKRNSRGLISLRQ